MSQSHQKYTDAYIQILGTYDKYLSDSIINKKTLKHSFFEMIKKLLFLLTALFIFAIIASFLIFTVLIFINYQSVSVVTGAVTALISSFVTMLIAILKLPKIIAEYLFNKEEDDKMNDIIKNIQSYEISSEKYQTIRNEAIADSEKIKGNIGEDEKLKEKNSNAENDMLKKQSRPKSKENKPPDSNTVTK